MLRRLDRLQTTSSSLGMVAVLRDHRVLIGQLQLAVIEPHGDPAARQSALGIEIEAPYADIATPIDDPFELQMTNRPGEVVRIQLTATDPAENRHGGTQTVSPLLVRPMGCFIRMSR